MTIAGARQMCKGWLERIPRDVLVVTALILASSAGFGLGYLTGQDAGQGSGVTIQVVPPAGAAGQTVSAATPEPAAAAAAGVSTGAQVQVGQYVASKNGTKYYLPNCSGAKRISDTNKVWFATAAAATAQGYTPAANCPGL